MKVTSKRRRTKQEIIEEEAAALAKAEAVEKKLKLIDELQEKQIKLEAEQETGKKAQDAIAAMLASGFIMVN